MKVTEYRMKSLHSLFRDYAFENGRIDQEDAATTQRLIREELHRRLDAAIAALGEADGSDDREAEKIKNYFMSGRL